MTQEQALKMLMTGRNAFVTGEPGSGKTYLINKYIERLKASGINAGITASTGIAATHIGGVTIHSWAGIGTKESLTQGDLEKIAGKQYVRRRLLKAGALIIDEVSMLHPAQLEMTDRVAREIRGSEEPFGGMQVVLVGDMFQLPPVSRTGNAGNIMASEIWKRLQPEVCYITEQHRHREGGLMTILKDIRRGRTSREAIRMLQERFDAELENENFTRLHTHNANVDRLNAVELDQISGEAEQYKMSSAGNKALVQSLIRSCLAPEELELKTGALVMFVKNNSEKGYVNGTQGKVIDFQKYTSYPIVETLEGKVIVAEPESWRIEEEGKVKAEITQIPLRLAWAITVHKSQGMTLEAAEMDLSRSFVPGMGYVALSRVRSLEGLRLKGLNQTALVVDPAVLATDLDLRAMSEQSAKKLAELKETEIEKAHQNFTKEASRAKSKTLEKTNELLKQKLTIPEIARRRNLTEGTIISHIEKLVKRQEASDISHLSLPPEDMREIARVMRDDPERRLSPARQKLGNKYSYDLLRVARLFLPQEK